MARFRLRTPVAHELIRDAVSVDIKMLSGRARLHMLGGLRNLRFLTSSLWIHMVSTIRSRPPDGVLNASRAVGVLSEFLRDQSICREIQDLILPREDPHDILMNQNSAVLRLVKEAQQKHGLRHDDFQRYRSYCSRRIRRLRCALNFLQGTKNRYNPKSVSDEVLAKTGDLRYPCIVLMQVGLNDT